MAVRIEKNGPVWTVIHDRPQARNAMDPASADALTAAFLEFDADQDAAVAVVDGAGGRDHHPGVWTIIMGGGSIQGGRVIGRTDARAERPTLDPHGPENLSATIFHLLGIDPAEEFYTPDGRPVPIVNQGRVIQELLRSYYLGGREQAPSAQTGKRQPASHAFNVLPPAPRP